QFHPAARGRVEGERDRLLAPGGPVDAHHDRQPLLLGRVPFLPADDDHRARRAGGERDADGPGEQPFDAAEPPAAHDEHLRPTGPPPTASPCSSAGSRSPPRTTTTGPGAPAASATLTAPANSPSTRPTPRLPTTSTSALRASAPSTARGEPTTTSASTSVHGATRNASARACASCASARPRSIWW